MTRYKIVSRKGQSTVEFIAVIPLVIVLIFISYNALSFLSAAAQFDRVARTSSLVWIAVGDKDASARITEDLRAAFPNDQRYQFEVNLEDYSTNSNEIFSLAAGATTSTCSMKMALWPRIDSFIGIETGIPLSVSHTTQIVVDPYRSAVVV